MILVTGTTSPSLNRILARVPVAGAGTSMATFSVSTVRTGSSNLMKSPSFLDDEMMVAFSWSISNLGMMKGTGMSDPSLHHGTDLLFDIVLLRDGDLFEPAVIRDGDILPAKASHRCIDVIEGRASDNGCDNLSGPAARLAGFMNNQQTSCAPHRIDNGLRIKRQQRT